VLLVAVGAAGGGAALAIASVPDSNGVIHACVELAQNGLPQPTPGNLRIIDPPAEMCTTTSPAGGLPPESSISWNQTGPPGPTGATGPSGAPGATGNTLTIAGQTFSLSNGKALTISGTPLIAPLAVKTGGRPVAELTGLDLGRGAPSTIELDSWSFGASQGSSASRGSGGGAGKVSVHDIQITKTVDKSSPLLFKACASGKHFPKVTLTVRKAGKPYLMLTLSGVLISSYQQSNGGSERPAESLSLNFTKIEYQYSK
jgi:type VI secretion system secreted protein Hcp